MKKRDYYILNGIVFVLAVAITLTILYFNKGGYDYDLQMMNEVQHLENDEGAQV